LNNREERAEMKKIIIGFLGAMLLAAFLIGCTPLAGGPGGSDTAPLVSSTIPANNETNAGINRAISATFTGAMDAATLTTSTFLVTSGTTSIAGTVTYLGTTAVFTPSANLPSGSLCTATINTGAKNPAGTALGSNYAWSFTTSAGIAKGPGPVVLGTAGNFVILAKTGISSVPTSAVTGNLGVSPAAATYITGFSLVADSTNVFSKSSQVTGNLYAANYAVPTPSNLTTAVSAMETAYTDAAGRAIPDYTELYAGDLSGKTLVPGLYKWGTGVLINTDVTLSGAVNDVWIFQIAGDLTMASGKKVILMGGAMAKNVFWQVGGGVGVALGTGAHLEGILLATKAIKLATGASANGRLLAQTAVTIDGSTVVQPAQ
jgi:hypothetical protein